ncbi:MAG: fibronectin type III domain-containing protein [Gallionella sp.]|nr:fibronectin type III domain-containing protein [Gallionella sp.]MDD4947502.1 fibronectin type III domain-containing protein [Gallionella sp.]
MGTGPSSAASNSVIPSIAVPGAPQNVSATGGATRASVSFNPPASDGGSPILGYTVTANPAGPTDSNANGTALTHLITGLVGGTTYTFTVTASNLAGSGPASLPSNRITANATEGQTYYIHADHLDTPRVITDTAGNVVWSWDSIDPFGNNVPNQNPSGLGTFEFNLRFAGQYFDKETGLHQNHFRDGYNPAIGAYTQFDPVGLRGGINGFAYVKGNPLSYVDPLGLWCVSQAAADSITGGAGGLVGGFVGSGGNWGVAALSGTIGAATGYALSGTGVLGGTLGGAAGGFSAIVKGGGGLPGMIGGTVGGAMSGGLAATASGDPSTNNSAGGFVGGLAGGFLGGLLTPTVGNNPLPLTGAALGALGGLAGGLTQDIANQLLKSHICNCGGN